jgi:hypothetical protein
VVGGGGGDVAAGDVGCGVTMRAAVVGVTGALVTGTVVAGGDVGAVVV